MVKGRNRFNENILDRIDFYRHVHVKTIYKKSIDKWQYGSFRRAQTIGYMLKEQGSYVIDLLLKFPLDSPPCPFDDSGVDNSVSFSKCKGGLYYKRLSMYSNFYFFYDNFFRVHTYFWSILRMTVIAITFIHILIQSKYLTAVYEIVEEDFFNDELSILFLFRAFFLADIIFGAIFWSLGKGRYSNFLEIKPSGFLYFLVIAALFPVRDFILACNYTDVKEETFATLALTKLFFLLRFLADIHSLNKSLYYNDLVVIIEILIVAFLFFISVVSGIVTYPACVIFKSKICDRIFMELSYKNGTNPNYGILTRKVQIFLVYCVTVTSTLIPFGPFLAKFNFNYASLIPYVQTFFLLLFYILAYCGYREIYRRKNSFEIANHLLIRKTADYLDTMKLSRTFLNYCIHSLYETTKENLYTPYPNNNLFQLYENSYLNGYSVFMEKVKLFETLAKSQRNFLSVSLKCKYYERFSKIYRINTVKNKFVYLIQGEMGLMTTTNEPVPIRRFPPGSSFGASSLLYPQVCHYTLYACKPCHVLEMYYSDVIDMWNNNPTMIKEILQNVEEFCFNQMHELRRYRGLVLPNEIPSCLNMGTRTKELGEVKLMLRKRGLDAYMFSGTERFVIDHREGKCKSSTWKILPEEYPLTSRMWKIYYNLQLLCCSIMIPYWSLTRLRILKSSSDMSYMWSVTMTFLVAEVIDAFSFKSTDFNCHIPNEIEDDSKKKSRWISLFRALTSAKTYAKMIDYLSCVPLFPVVLLGDIFPFYLITDNWPELLVIFQFLRCYQIPGTVFKLKGYSGNIFLWNIFQSLFYSLAIVFNLTIVAVRIQCPKVHTCIRMNVINNLIDRVANKSTNIDFIIMEFFKLAINVFCGFSPWNKNPWPTLGFTICLILKISGMIMWTYSLVLLSETWYLNPLISNKFLYFRKNIKFMRLFKQNIYIKMMLATMFSSIWREKGNDYDRHHHSKIENFPLSYRRALNFKAIDFVFRQTLYNFRWTRETRMTFLQNARSLIAAPHCVLAVEGEPINQLQIIRRGYCNVFDDNDEVIGVLYAGDLICDYDGLLGLTSSATVISASNVEIWTVPKSIFQCLMGIDNESFFWNAIVDAVSKIMRLSCFEDESHDPDKDSDNDGAFETLYKGSLINVQVADLSLTKFKKAMIRRLRKRPMVDKEAQTYQAYSTNLSENIFALSPKLAVAEKYVESLTSKLLWMSLPYAECWDSLFFSNSFYSAVSDETLSEYLPREDPWKLSSVTHQTVSLAQSYEIESLWRTPPFLRETEESLFARLAEQSELKLYPVETITQLKHSLYWTRHYLDDTSIPYDCYSNAPSMMSYRFNRSPGSYNLTSVQPGTSSGSDQMISLPSSSIDDEIISRGTAYTDFFTARESLSEFSAGNTEQIDTVSLGSSAASTSHYVSDRTPGRHFRAKHDIFIKKSPRASASGVRKGLSKDLDSPTAESSSSPLAYESIDVSSEGSVKFVGEVPTTTALSNSDYSNSLQLKTDSNLSCTIKASEELSSLSTSETYSDASGSSLVYGVRTVFCYQFKADSEDTESKSTENVEAASNQLIQYSENPAGSSIELSEPTENATPTIIVDRITTLEDTDAQTSFPSQSSKSSVPSVWYGVPLSGSQTDLTNDQSATDRLKDIMVYRSAFDQLFSALFNIDKRDQASQTDKLDYLATLVTPEACKKEPPKPPPAETLQESGDAGKPYKKGRYLRRVQIDMFSVWNNSSSFFVKRIMAVFRVIYRSIWKVFLFMGKWAYDNLSTYEFDAFVYLFGVVVTQLLMAFVKIYYIIEMCHSQKAYDVRSDTFYAVIYLLICLKWLLNMMEPYYKKDGVMVVNEASTSWHYVVHHILCDSFVNIPPEMYIEPTCTIRLRTLFWLANLISTYRLKKVIEIKYILGKGLGYVHWMLYIIIQMLVLLVFVFTCLYVFTFVLEVNLMFPNTDDIPYYNCFLIPDESWLKDLIFYGVPNINLTNLPTWMFYFAVNFLRRQNLPYLSSEGIDYRLHLPWPALFGHWIELCFLAGLIYSLRKFFSHQLFYVKDVTNFAKYSTDINFEHDEVITILKNYDDYFDSGQSQILRVGNLLTNRLKFEYFMNAFPHAFLKNSTPLRYLTDDFQFFNEIVSMAKEEVFNERCYLFTEGSLYDKVSLILEGSVTAYNDIDRDELLRPGSIFGNLECKGFYTLKNRYWANEGQVTLLTITSNEMLKLSYFFDETYKIICNTEYFPAEDPNSFDEEDFVDANEYDDDKDEEIVDREEMEEEERWKEVRYERRSSMEYSREGSKIEDIPNKRVIVNFTNLETDEDFAGRELERKTSAVYKWLSKDYLFDQQNIVAEKQWVPVRGIREASGDDFSEASLCQMITHAEILKRGFRSYSENGLEGNEIPEDFSIEDSAMTTVCAFDDYPFDKESLTKQIMWLDEHDTDWYFNKCYKESLRKGIDDDENSTETESSESNVEFEKYCFDDKGVYILGHGDEDRDYSVSKDQLLSFIAHYKFTLIKSPWPAFVETLFVIFLGMLMEKLIHSDTDNNLIYAILMALLMLFNLLRKGTEYLQLAHHKMSSTHLLIDLIWNFNKQWTGLMLIVTFTIPFEILNDYTLPNYSKVFHIFLPWALYLIALITFRKPNFKITDNILGKRVYLAKFGMVFVVTIVLTFLSMALDFIVMVDEWKIPTFQMVTFFHFKLSVTIKLLFNIGTTVFLGIPNPLYAIYLCIISLIGLIITAFFLLAASEFSSNYQSNDNLNYIINAEKIKQLSIYADQDRNVAVMLKRRIKALWYHGFCGSQFPFLFNTLRSTLKDHATERGIRLYFDEHPLFSNLPLALRKQLEMEASFMYAVSGTELATIGGYCCNIYIIMEGIVHAQMDDTKDNIYLQGFVKAYKDNDVLGLVEATANKPYLWSWRVAKSCKLWVIPRVRWNQSLKEYRDRSGTSLDIIRIVGEI